MNYSIWKMIKLSVLNLYSIVLTFVCGGRCSCSWAICAEMYQCIFKRWKSHVVLAYWRSEIDAILSKIIKALMFIFLKDSVFYDVKKLLILIWFLEFFFVFKMKSVWNMKCLLKSALFSHHRENENWGNLFVTSSTKLIFLYA